MFASLLAAHLDPDQQKGVHPSYTKVLSQLSPLDARFIVAFRSLVSAVWHGNRGCLEQWYQ